MPSGIRSTRRLRSWIVEQVSSGKFHGLIWDDPDKTMFRIPWKHAGKQDFRSEEDGAIFKAWAEFKGKLPDDKPANPASWKTRLRCALNKSPEFMEVIERSQLDISEPYKVYRLVPESEQGGACASSGRAKASTTRRRKRKCVKDSEEEEEDEEEEEEVVAKMKKEEDSAVEQIDFVNGHPMHALSAYSNPILAGQLMTRTREQLGCYRQEPTLRSTVQYHLQTTSSTDNAEETKPDVDTVNAGEMHPLQDTESPEPLALPECCPEREPEEELTTAMEKKLHEENKELKLHLSFKDVEICNLKAQITSLEQKTLTPELLENSAIPGMFHYSSGFTYDRFNELCTIFGIPNYPHTVQIKASLIYKRKDRKIHMPLRSQFLYVLMKLRNNEDLQILAFRFNITLTTASNIFNSWISHMFNILGELAVWPHRDVITQNMPESYKASYPNTFAILHCTELKIQRPTSLALQSQSNSNYNSTSTLKSLVVCDPRGAVIFSSALYPGSMSDKEIVKQCGIIELLQKLMDWGYLQKGDGLMAHKDFLMKGEIEALGLHLNLPPLSRSQRQMPAGDVLEAKRIAKHRVLVERAISKIKRFKIVSGRIPNTWLGSIDYIWYVVSMLSNFQPHKLRK